VVMGDVNSTDGDRTGNSLGGYDIWIVKLNNSYGEITWDRSLGDANKNNGYSFRQTSDGGYVVAGWTETGSSPNIWVYKLSGAGAPEWDEELMRAGIEDQPVIQQISACEYVLVGRAGATTARDYWVVKLAP